MDRSLPQNLLIRVSLPKETLCLITCRNMLSKPATIFSLHQNPLHIITHNIVVFPHNRLSHSEYSLLPIFLIQLYTSLFLAYSGAYDNSFISAHFDN